MPEEEKSSPTAMNTQIRICSSCLPIQHPVPEQKVALNKLRCGVYEQRLNSHSDHCY